MEQEFRLGGRFGTPVRRRFTTGYDGTRISYYVAGRGPRPWVLAPGLGTNILCWKYLFEEYAQRYTMYTWDPRGTYASAPPSDLSRLHVEDHERDMVSVCAAEGLDRFVAGGWSMGVEISLEFCRNHPDRVAALTLINGPYEHVLSTALGLPGA
ncbi:MAG: alpha/beta hydrolase, partial [Deltaproteobacteria bacterium]|nr:alpha/beta hydrolase [Deltaproteobacteria bacterium]